MDVGSFPSHGVEQAKFGIGAAQGSEFDTRAVRAETANDPAAAKLNEGIGTTNGAVDDGLVKNFGWAGIFGGLEAFSPASGGWNESFGFTGDAPPVPIGNGNVAGVSKTAESGGAVGEAIPDARTGHEMFDGVDGADGSFRLERRKRIHALPEMDGIAQLAFGDAAQPLVLLAQDEGLALFVEAFAIAFEECNADIFPLNGKASGFDREVRADGEADEIDGVGHGPGFVEVVDAPDEAALDVAPGAEILDVKVANGENFWSLGKIGTDFRPELHPAVVGGAEEGKDFRLHALVLEAEIFFVETGALPEP